MSEGGESSGGWSWKMMLPDWMRKGREKVDLTDVPVEKLQRAHEERGIEVDTTLSDPDQRIVTVTKVAVKGDGPFTPPS